MLGQGAARPWQRLERRHGPLGWRPSALVQHSWPGLIATLPPWLQEGLTTWLPVSRVDGRLLQAGLGAALEAEGVQRLQARVETLEPVGLREWRLRLGPAPVVGTVRARVAETELKCAAVVLAAGSGCRHLWPPLPGRLRSSWAGVLVLPRIPAGNPWLDHGRRGRVVQPRRWRRPSLEARAAELQTPEWVVDAGLAPWGEGALLGQISLVRPGTGTGAPPDPSWMEARLREGLSALDAELGTTEGQFRQVPVPFCIDGRGLAGPVEGAPGLWAFTGFSGAFTVVPPLAERLADVMARSLVEEGTFSQRLLPPGIGIVSDGSEEESEAAAG